MAHALLRLQIDPATGRRDLWIDYLSDPDALPSEHEEAHRLVVERLLSEGLDLGRVLFARAGGEAVVIAESATSWIAEKRKA